VLEPQADALRNFAKPGFRGDAAQRMIDRAQLLGLSAPQLTALLGGLRALGISEGSLGVLTHRPGVLSTDFFRNLLDMGTQWSRSSAEPEVLEGRDRASGALRWTGSVVDLSVRQQRAAARAGRGLRRRRRRGRLPARLQRRLGAGDGGRPLRAARLSRP
jgi:catalase (peroxidase I)